MAGRIPSPPEDSIRVHTDDRPTGPSPGRRWVPFALAFAALVGFSAIAGGLLGSDESAGPATTTTTPDLAAGATAEDAVTTTTTTFPATLAERLPGFEGIITLAARTENGGHTILWGSTERQGRLHDLTAQPDQASFDASGTWIAYLAFTDANPTLFVGLRTSDQRAEATAVTSAVWHPTVERVLSWVTRLPTDGRTVLLVGQVDARSGILAVSREAVEVPAGSRVVAWGEWGYAIASDVRGVPILTVLDPGGNPTVAAPVSLLGATIDGGLLVESHLGRFTALDVDGAALENDLLAPALLDIPGDGETYLTDATLVPARPGPAVPRLAQVAIHPGGERAAVVEVRESSFTAVTSYGLLPRQVPRITSVAAPARLIGYSGNGQYVILQEIRADGGPGVVFIIDWNTGTEARLEVKSEILAAEMQPTLAPGTGAPSTTTTTPPPAPSQSPGDAARDGVIAELAALAPAERAEVLVSVAADQGDFATAFPGYTWVLARPPQELQAAAGADGCRFGDLSGTYPVDVICLSEYGEILLLDAAGQIVRAYPMPGAPPSWILVTDAVVWAGRIGDGGLPDSTVVRIDRASLEHEVVVVPAPFDGGTEWLPRWRVATRDQAAAFGGLITTGPAAAGTATASWIGRVVVDLGGLIAWFAGVVG